MALTDLQRRICRLLAERRIASGERYVAGGVALNEVLRGGRVINLFHDTEEAVASASASDRELLRESGFEVEPVRELRGFVEVEVRERSSSVIVQWVRETAFRFFPLVAHPLLGLTLHPFDLATNKVLALVGRVEVRDWVDILTCHEELSPLGCLAWAACGKDPGLSPAFILEEAARTARYSPAEVRALAFEGEPPDAAALSRTWRRALDDARSIATILPAEHVGCAVLEAGAPFRGDAASLAAALGDRRLHFHPGSIGGALPVVHAVERP